MYHTGVMKSGRTLFCGRRVVCVSREK